MLAKVAASSFYWKDLQFIATNTISVLIMK